MSATSSVERNEPSAAAANGSYRWAYTFVVFALLLDVMYRAIVFHEASWDLLAMVVVGGIVCTIYQVRTKTLVRGWATKVMIAMSVAAVIAFIVAATLFRGF